MEQRAFFDIKLASGELFTRTFGCACFELAVLLVVGCSVYLVKMSPTLLYVRLGVSPTNVSKFVDVVRVLN